MDERVGKMCVEKRLLAIARMGLMGIDETTIRATRGARSASNLICNKVGDSSH